MCVYIYLIQISLLWGVCQSQRSTKYSTGKEKQGKKKNLNWQEWFRLKMDWTGSIRILGNKRGWLVQHYTLNIQIKNKNNVIKTNLHFLIPRSSTKMCFIAFKEIEIVVLQKICLITLSENINYFLKKAHKHY